MDARRSCHERLDVSHDRMLVRRFEQLKAGTDGHDGCGITAIAQAGTYNSTKQLRRDLEELLSNATPPPRQID